MEDTQLRLWAFCEVTFSNKKMLIFTNKNTFHKSGWPLPENSMARAVFSFRRWSETYSDCFLFFTRSMPSACFAANTKSPLGSHLRTALCEQEEHKFE